MVTAPPQEESPLVLCHKSVVIEPMQRAQLDLASFNIEDHVTRLTVAALLRSALQS